MVEKAQSIDRLIVWFGQSITTGSEGFPTITTGRNDPDVLMVGKRLVGWGTDNWEPASAFHPLNAYVWANDKVMTDEEVRTLSANSMKDGEAPGHAMGYAVVDAMRARGIPGRVVVACAGVGGKSLSYLAGEGYGRFTGLVKNAFDISAREGRKLELSACCWAQGDSEFGQPTNDKVRYRAALKALFERMRTDAAPLTGQGQEPEILLFQFSGDAVWNRDKRRRSTLPIPQAQLDVSAEVTLVGPYYQFRPQEPRASKSHLDAVGYSSLGKLAARAYIRTAIDGLPWQSLQPIEVALSGRKLIAKYGSEVTGLQFLPLRSGAQPANKGYSVTDLLGRIALLKVEITGQAEVTISLSRRPIGRPTLWYGRSEEAGAGNLADGADPNEANWSVIGSWQMT